MVVRSQELKMVQELQTMSVYTQQGGTEEGGGQWEEQGSNLQ